MSDTTIGIDDGDRPRKKRKRSKKSEKKAVQDEWNHQKRIHKMSTELIEANNSRVADRWLQIQLNLLGALHSPHMHY